MKRQGKEEGITMDEKIWWKCNGCGYMIQLDIGKLTPNPCPACKNDCTFTNVTCYKPECGGPQSGNFDPTLV
jgi:rubrerythrin